MQKHKIVYVLVSNSNDCYCEQAYISISSLKNIMPCSYVTILMDNRTQDTLNGKRGNIINICDEIIAIPFPDDIDNRARSRYLKTTMRNYITDDFLFIDCDTVICENLSDIFSLESDIAAVLDGHMTLDEYSGHKKLIEQSGLCLNGNSYFNSGVIWCKDTERCHEFFDRWHTLYLATCDNEVYVDQVSFNKTNEEFGNLIYELNGIWNCQIEIGIKFLGDAKILHYFSNTGWDKKAYLLGNNDVFNRMKESKELPDELHNLIKSPKSAFRNSVIIAADSIRGSLLLDSKCFSLLKQIYIKHKNIYSAMENILSFLSSIVKKPQRKK